MNRTRWYIAIGFMPTVGDSISTVWASLTRLWMSATEMPAFASASWIACWIRPGVLIRSRMRRNIRTAVTAAWNAAIGLPKVSPDLGLEPRIGDHRGALALRHARPPLALLHHVRELVAEQRLAAVARRIVLAAAEVDVLALRIRLRAHRVGAAVLVHADPGEVGAERALHLAAQSIGQRRAARGRLARHRRGVRGRGCARRARELDRLDGRALADGVCGCAR
jgi:hypothetical protein